MSSPFFLKTLFLKKQGFLCYRGFDFPEAILDELQKL